MTIVLNTYQFRVTTEGQGSDESIQQDIFSVADVTPHEAWGTVGQMLMEMEEHDRVIVRVELL